jgi:transposase
MEQPTRFVGMDVHKDTIVMAVTATGEVGKATPYGTIRNTTAAVEKLVKRLRKAGTGTLKFCYEAGACGYGVYRTLTRLGEDCLVAVPSMIPRRSVAQRPPSTVHAHIAHRTGLTTPGRETAFWALENGHDSPRAGVSSISRVMAFGGRRWLSHHRSTMACVSRISVHRSGAFSQRDRVG